MREVPLLQTPELLDSEILMPAVMMIIVTMLVWGHLLYARIRQMTRAGIDPQDYPASGLLQQVLPEAINRPADNLKNLFELPVIFYVLVVLIYLTQSADPFLLGMAWMFAFFRALHSLIHCTYNRVVHRFAVYMVSSLALWAMLFRFLSLLIVDA